MAPPPARLKTRGEYLRVAASRVRFVAPGFILQAASRSPEPGTPTPFRVGFTASRKVGSAVVRNRARRRLKALAAEVMSGRAPAGWDFVLIARAETPKVPWRSMVADLGRGLDRLTAPRSRAPEGSR